MILCDKKGVSRQMSTILVVDDDKLIRILLYRILSKMGHIVLEAENGMEAVRICRLLTLTW